MTNKVETVVQSYRDTALAGMAQWPEVESQSGNWKLRNSGSLDQWHK